MPATPDPIAIRQREADWLRAQAILITAPDTKPSQLASAINVHVSRAASFIKRYQEGQEGQGKLPAPPSSPPGARPARLTGSGDGATMRENLEAAATAGAAALREAAEMQLDRVRQADKVQDVGGLREMATFVGIAADKLRDLRKAEAGGSLWEDVLSADTPELLDDMIEETRAQSAILAARRIPLD